MNIKFTLRLLAFVAIFLSSKNIKATIFTNSSSITINDNAASSLYPSPIAVSGMAGVITNVEVTINNLSHTWVHDVSIILQAPTGQSLLLQSGTADNLDANNLTYTISDLAATQFSSSAIWANNGSYKPTSYFWDIWPAPAPPTPPGIGTYNTPGPFGFMTETMNSTFGGLNPNGTWKLFVADFASGDFGVITNGWSINIAASVVTPVTLKKFEVVKQNDLARLYWNVSNERNMEKYVVESSIDNVVFKTIGEVICSEDISIDKEYNFADNLMGQNKMYYRLKMMDKDQKYTYSHIETISCLKNDIYIKVYPSITSNLVQIESNEALKKVSVFSIAGIKIADFFPNENAYTLHTNNMVGGIYFIHIEGESNTVLEKIVVVK